MNTRSGNVLHFIDTTGPGGAETIFLQVAEGMSRRGWGGCAAITGPGWVLDTAHQRGLTVELVPTRGRFDLSYIARLRGIVRRHRIDLIHAHLFSPAVYASAVSAWTGVPVVATLHGASCIIPGGLPTRLRYRLINRQARVVCVSESLRDDLHALSVIHPSQVHVIHNGTDPSVYASASGQSVRREHRIAEDAILVGALGNMRPAKDFPTFLRAAAALAGDARFRFAIVGECSEPLCSELRKLADELGITDRVGFWGFRDDVPEVLAAFDVLAISSDSEGFSLAAIQAMAAGTPVVATRSGGPEQILTDGVDGLLVPVRDPVALAAAIRRVVEDTTLAGQLTAAARRTMEARFSLETMLDGYEALYRRVLNLPSRASAVESNAATAVSSGAR